MLCSRPPPAHVPLASQLFPTRISHSLLYSARERILRVNVTREVRGGIPRVDAILRQHVSSPLPPPASPPRPCHRESGTNDNVFPADAAVKSSEIQVYPS